MVRIGGDFADFGRGQYNPNLPEDIPVEFASFAGGYNSADRREDVHPTGSPNCIDVEVDAKDRLIRAPGVGSVEDFGVREAKYLIPHTSLDFRSELVFFDPPFIGVKADAGTIWTDVGLDAAYDKDFAWTNYAGTLLFTNGLKVYKKVFKETAVTELTQMPVAYAYATFAGRVFALSAFIGGSMEPMGIAWSSAVGTYDDWTGTGSGHEFLIADAVSGDHGVALRPMGLDFMAVLLRRSIWIARRTGLRDRPADLRPAVFGVGAVNAEVCRTTMQGVVFLSDTGVYVFDGNRETHISAAIDNELLPLDYDNIKDYKGFYEIRTNRYYLLTPTTTWIYDFKFQRWYRWSLLARFGVEFAPQLPATTWADLVGQTWASLAGTRWSDFAGREGQGLETYFVGDLAGTDHLGKVNVGIETFFGVSQEPRWDFVQMQGRPSDQMFTTKAIFLEYIESGQVSLYLPNSVAQFELAVEQTLMNYADPHLTRIPIVKTGRGAGLRLEITAGTPKILSAALKIMGRSAHQLPADFVAREYHQDF